MTKKSHQVASRYARRSGQRKRKRPPQSAAPSPEAKLAPDKPAQAGVQRIASQQTELRSKQVTEPRPTTSDRLRVPAVTATHPYIAADLKRIGIITGVIFVLLILLAIIFG
jgi:hypothetical protein